MKFINELLDKSKKKFEFISIERQFYDSLPFKVWIKDHFYEGFLIYECPPENNFKSVRYNICYRFRVIYQWRFISKVQAEQFIDDHFWDLKFWVNLEHKSSDYFTWWFNYYGELIN